MQPKHPERGLNALLTRFIRRLSPVSSESAARLSDDHWEDVRREFKLHQAMAELICILGLVGGFFLPFVIAPPMQVWDIAIGFAAMANMPLIYILLICKLKGFRSAYSRFADYSTRKYAIPWSTQLLIYKFFLLVGVIAIVGRILYPIPIN